MPFGPKPRLILCYLNAQALKTRSSVIETAFVKRLGLVSKGRNMHIIKTQLVTGRMTDGHLKTTPELPPP